MPRHTIYQGRAVALLTQHGKELLLAPVLDRHLGCAVTRVSGYDTDQLGTFTRDLPRAGTQIEAARRKARMGMTLSGLPLGLASEGAFGADPMAGLLPWNVEMLVWLDDERSLEVVGRAQGPACHHHRRTSDWDEARQFTQQMGFPEQGLVLRPDGPDHPLIEKALTDWAALEDGFHRLRDRSTQGAVFLETDGRAHRNPTRQKMILAAAEDLVAALASLCPACGSPGFWRAEAVGRRPCELCGRPTRLPAADRYRCPHCGHQEDRPRPGPVTADPQHCEDCNP